jgi:ribosome-binding factor A
VTPRTDRVDELLRQEIGSILARDVADPRIGFATITDVETAPDLRHAKVWVSVIGTDAERTATLAALDRAMGFVRRELGTRLRLRRIPDLHVRLDETAERGTRVLRLLDELEAGVEPDPDPAADPLPTPVGRIRRPGDAAEPAEAAAESPAARPSSRSRAHRPRRGRPR